MSQFLKFIEFNQYNLPILVNVLAIYLLIIWLAVVAWVIKDITTRTRNLLIIIFTATLILIGNLPTLIIYLLIRPEKTIEDSKDKDLFYASVLDKNVSSCPTCNALVRTDFKFCPNCSTDLNLTCPNCKLGINPIWKFCVNCNYDLHPHTSLIDILSKPIKLFSTQISTLLKRLRHQVNIQRIKIDLRLRELAIIPKNLPDITIPAKNIAEVLPSVGLKTIAEKKYINEVTITTEVADIARLTKKRGRGRPKGIIDSKPRSSRADAGKKRAKYRARNIIV